MQLGIAVTQPVMDRVIPGYFKSLIHRNSTIPTSRAEKFYTIYPDQDTVRIEVYPGEHEFVAQNIFLGDFSSPGWNPALTTARLR